MSTAQLAYHPFQEQRQQVKFNQTLSGARQTVERAFGNLKSRFRRLRDVLLHNHEDIYQLIMACCFLHNICVLNEDEIEEYSE